MLHLLRSSSSLLLGFLNKFELRGSVARVLTIISACQRARALLYRDGISYTDILNRGIGPSRRGFPVRFSPSLSSPAPASAVSEFMSSKRTSVYITVTITTITTSNQFVPIASTIPLMEVIILNDFPLPRPKVCKSPISLPLSQRHTNRGGGYWSVSVSRASVSSFQVATGAGA